MQKMSDPMLPTIYEEAEDDGNAAELEVQMEGEVS